MFVALCQSTACHQTRSFHAACIECLPSKGRETQNFKKILKIASHELPILGHIVCL